MCNRGSRWRSLCEAVASASGVGLRMVELGGKLRSREREQGQIGTTSVSYHLQTLATGLTCETCCALLASITRALGQDPVGPGCCPDITASPQRRWVCSGTRPCTNLQVSERRSVACLCLPNPAHVCFVPTLTWKLIGKGILGSRAAAQLSWRSEVTRRRHKLAVSWQARCVVTLLTHSSAVHFSSQHLRPPLLLFPTCIWAFLGLPQFPLLCITEPKEPPRESDRSYTPFSRNSSSDLHKCEMTCKVINWVTANSDDKIQK